MACWDKVSATVHDFVTEKLEPIYTVKEAASFLGVSEQSLNRWDRCRHLVAYRTSHNNRVYRYYTESQLNNFMKSDFYNQLAVIKNRDLIGQTFGKLHVIDFSEKAKQKGYYGSYHCVCDCGNEVDIPRSELIAKKALSCGCRYHDLSGQTFGYWHVDSLAEPLITPSGIKVIRYNCTCKCGSKRVVIARTLTSGASFSCGCYRDERAMSKYEFCVCQYLNEHGFLEDNVKASRGYTRHKTYSDLKGLGNGYLSYDFYVWNHGKEWLIECQGGQHYFPVDLWGGEEVFAKQVEHDKRKADYAANHNIPLLEIPYTAFQMSMVADLLNKFGVT